MIKICINSKETARFYWKHQAIVDLSVDKKGYQRIKQFKETPLQKVLIQTEDGTIVG